MKKMHTGRLCRFAAAAITLAAFNPAISQAAEFTTVQTNVGPVMTITGPIETGDDRKFDAELKRYPEVKIVYLRSEGGEVASALNIGTTFHRYQMRAVVEDGDYCLSACALAWLGSPSRTLYRRSQIGFHAAWRTDVNGIQEDGVANAMIGHYISSIGLPVETVIYATSAAPTTLTYLPTHNSKWRGIEYILEEP